jgi:hypothetical protein
MDPGTVGCVGGPWPVVYKVGNSPETRTVSEGYFARRKIAVTESDKVATTKPVHVGGQSVSIPIDNVKDMGSPSVVKEYSM